MIPLSGDYPRMHQSRPILGISILCMSISHQPQNGLSSVALSPSRDQKLHTKSQRSVQPRGLPCPPRRKRGRGSESHGTNSASNHPSPHSTPNQNRDETLATFHATFQNEIYCDILGRRICMTQLPWLLVARSDVQTFRRSDLRGITLSDQPKRERNDMRSHFPWNSSWMLQRCRILEEMVRSAEV